MDKASGKLTVYFEYIPALRNPLVLHQMLPSPQIVYHLQYVQIHLPKMVLQNIPSV